MIYHFINKILLSNVTLHSRNNNPTRMRHGALMTCALKINIL